MSAYTPGPWTIENPEHSIGSIDSVPTGNRVGQAFEVSVKDRNSGNPQRIANARLMAAAPELLEALHVVSECGDPCKVSLYDEEGIEGWRWTHPDGREWEEVGEWREDPPLHPVARAAIAKATGEQP